MKSISYIWVLFACLLLTSCYEDDMIVPDEFGGSGRFEFPQGTNSWDEEIGEIYNDYGVRLIYKDIVNEDFDRDWIGGSGGGGGGGFGTMTYHMKDCINNEMIQFYVRFMREHILNFTSPQIREKVLPMYWYLTFDFHNLYAIPAFNYYSYTAMTNQGDMKLMDFWVTCFWGQTVNADADPLTAWSSPTSGNKTNYDVQRFTIMNKIIKIAIERGNIVTPDEFSSGFDFSTPLITGETAENKADPNYYLTRGYAGSASIVGGAIYYNKPSSRPIAANNLFQDYLTLAIGFTAAQREEMFPAATYPLLKQKFDYVQNFMKQR
ncbi:hypothetical protein [uncultured Bacteroides sp.]|uniref:hypothetical protein n=1 Tax=uncultured Bacteroides sp. TaxID=162156 RepID=UPI0025EC85B5|nr:hypothetical protein [uncultured Bacteroides sp.]